ncbi:MAG: glutamate-cysteine ligase family protein [Tissierellia bacterium]|nr:glutamate-cysteine ligase family protein [Tissierellia bacterium]
MNKKEQIIKYIASGEVRKEKEFLGGEYEHILLDREGKALAYPHPRGASHIFKELTKRGWQPEREGDHILSLRKGDHVITTEPGGQIEYSGGPKKTVLELEEDLFFFYRDILPVLGDGDELYCIGFQPVSSIDSIEILPKARYHAMYDYFTTHGSHSHYMMKGTAALQLSMDYKCEKDYERKYGIACRLSNIFYALFDNAPFCEGRPTDIYGWRAYIWEHTDPARSGIPKEVFGSRFGYEQYAEFLLRTPAIFVLKNGKFSPFGGTIGEAMDEDTTTEELEHLMTMVFPDVRTKNFFEVRMVDSLPYPFNMGVIALMKNIFYNENNLDRLWNLLGDLSYKEHIRSRHELYEKGPMAKMMGKTLIRHGMDLFDALEICEDDRVYIEEILPLLEGNTLRRQMVAQWKKGYGIHDVIALSRVQRDYVEIK